MRVGIHFENLAEMEVRLRFVMAHLVDLRPFWPLVFRLYARWISDAFAQQGMPLPWTQLTPKYAAWKARKYPGRGILVRTGDMRRAYQAPIRQNEPHSMTLVVATEPASGYAPFHERGTVNMVRRSVMDALPPPLGINIGGAAQLQNAAEGYVDELLARAGLLKLGPLPRDAAPLTIGVRSLMTSP